MSLERVLHRSGFADVFVARPIFGIVINLLVLIAGLAALSGVDVREMPDVDQPVLSVQTIYEGAVPSTVDSEITQPLEDALSALEGLSYMESISSAGDSRITIYLSDSVDVDVAANEAREIVSETLRQLPDEIDDPNVSKSDSDSDAIIRLAVRGDAPFADLTEVAEGVIYDRLTTIDGIAEVTVRGSRSNQFRVTLDIPSLVSRGLTIDDVSNALQTLRDDTPLGELETTNQLLSLNVMNEDVTVETVSNIRINATTIVADIAFVQLTPEDSSVLSRVNGETAVGLDITRQSTANTLDISREVNAAVTELQSQLPDGVELFVASDDGVFIEQSIQEVVKSILFATIIVTLVILVFLRSFRATFIPAITIPVALIGTLAAIWLTGFSINTISLLALVLATGMVVDDAIVVIENIARKRKEGLGAFAAAAAGTNEVFFAVISTTATLAGVFIPISFLPGEAGGVFSEFGFVLAFAVTLSSFTALTLTPVLAALLDPGKRAANQADTAQSHSRLGGAFDKGVDQAIRLPILVIAITGAFVIIALGAANTLSSEITPSEDRGFFLVQARGASDTSLSYLDAQAVMIEDILVPYMESGEIETVQSIVGVRGGTSAFIIVRLPDWGDRDFSQSAFIADISGQLSAIPGVEVSARSTNSLNIRGSGSSTGLDLAVIGTNLETMTDAADDLVAAMAQDDTFLNPQLADTSVNAQLQISIDESVANDMGVSPADLSALISSYVQGEIAVSVFQNDTEVDIVLTPGGPAIDDPSDIVSVSVLLPDGGYVPMSVFAALEMAVAPAQIERQSGALTISLEASLPDGVDLSTAMARAQTLADEVLPDGTALIFTGEAAQLDESTSALYLVFGVALLVVLLVLAAQFESVSSAVVIMLTVPFGVAAALLAISITGGSLNYYSQIGLVLLIGVMAKNGILIVEFANQLRERGQDIDTAIRNAVSLRIRPVMMTMISTICGGLPLIMTSGAGAEARIAVGWVIVGGLGFATVFTLFLTPIFYRQIAIWGAEPGFAAKRLEDDLAARSA
ncbi:efflux RND transporter permease subunit [Gymnodinialimonas sp. 2305UL16-5]|uniref:efflux RND transporter permease subunit n=1 Tax=Gymnodinialimonas mytili TaxID=3126503 RepID=UPI0030A12719